MLQIGVDDREEPESLREEVEAIASGSINKSIICWNCQKKGQPYKQCGIEQKALFLYTCGLANTVMTKCAKCSHGNTSRNDRVAGNRGESEKAVRKITSSTEYLPAEEATPDRVHLSFQERLRRYKEIIDRIFNENQLEGITLVTKKVKKTRKNAIVEYLDYQIPVTQREMEICKQQSEIKMRHLPALWALEWAWQIYFWINR